VTIGYDPQSAGDARVTAAVHLAEAGDPRAADLLVVLAYDKALSGILRIRIAGVLQRLAPQRAAVVWATAALDASLPTVYRDDAVRMLTAGPDFPSTSEQASAETL
jgi:hypothetical protein